MCQQCSGWCAKSVRWCVCSIYLSIKLSSSLSSTSDSPTSLNLINHYQLPSITITRHPSTIHPQLYTTHDGPPPPLPYPRRHPLLRAPPWRPSPPSLLPHPFHPEESNVESRGHQSSLSLRSSRCDIFCEGHWGGDVYCECRCCGAGDEGVGSGLEWGIEFDGGVS